MMPRLVRCAIWLALSGPLAALAAPGRDDGACAAIEDRAARASCVAVGRSARAASPRSGPSSVRSVVEPATPGRAEAVDGRMIARAPDRYLRRALAMRGGDCRYLDVNRYVCAIAGAPPVEIRAHVIIPPRAQVAVEAGETCGGRDGTAASPRRRPCGTLMLFTPSAVAAGAGKVVLTTPSIWMRMPR